MLLLWLLQTENTSTEFSQRLTLFCLPMKHLIHERINCLYPVHFVYQVWWHTPVRPALLRLKQKDHESRASMGYMSRLAQQTGVQKI